MPSKPLKMQFSGKAYDSSCNKLPKGQTPKTTVSVERINYTFIHKQTNLVLRLDQRRTPVGFYKNGCPNCDALAHFHYRVIVESFQLNLLLWIVQDGA